MGDSVGALLDDFLARHVRVKNKASTAREVTRLIEKRIRPAWGARRVHDIAPRDVGRLLARIATTAPITANRALALLRKFFGWLVAQHILEASPAAGIDPPSAEIVHTRSLAADELRALWAATASRAPFPALVRLLLLTGQRRGEVAGMRWAELYLDRPDPYWMIPAERTKNKRDHLVPLAPLAVETIRRVPRVTDSEYVLTTDGDVPISGFSKGKRAVDKAMLAELRKGVSDPDKVELNGWRLHDLRRTVATGMQSIGQPVHVVEALLNHVSGTFGGIVGVYQTYSYNLEKRQAAEAWAARLAALTA